MSDVDIIRAWKDVDYRENLSAEQRALLPDNPAGAFELTEAQLGNVSKCSDVWACNSSYPPLTPTIVV